MPLIDMNQTTFPYIKCAAELVEPHPLEKFPCNKCVPLQTLQPASTCRTCLLRSRQLAKIAKFCLSRNIIKISFDVHF